MRIDDLNSAPQTQGTQGANKTEQAAQKRSQEQQNTANAAGDQAEISQLARALTVSDPQRIEQLRLEVQSGKYNVSADALAKSIIDAHLNE